MKRFAWMVAALLGIALSSGQTHAGWSHLFYSGYQPVWNIFAKRYKCLTPEEERLQKFWHDYYDAMKNYYKALDRIDWVAYYKNHGYQINAGGGYGGYGGACCGRINYAPVFVSPQLQWAVPHNAMGGPPVGVHQAGGYGYPGPYGPGCGPNGCPGPVTVPMAPPGGH
jgi:hypothetical protein